MLEEHPEDRPSLVRKHGVTNVIDLECLHHHDPPDLFEADEVTTATGRGLEPASVKPPLQEQVRDDRISPPKFGASFYS